MKNAHLAQVLENIAKASDLAVPLVISAGSHRNASMDNIRFRVASVRRGWRTIDHIPNALSVDDFSSHLELPNSQRVKAFRNHEC